MQKRLFLLLTLQLLLFFALALPPAASTAEDPLRPIHHLANQVYVSAQDMVMHGDEGHLHEIVEYGNRMIELSETLLEALEKTDANTLRGKKKQMIASVQGTLDMAKKAVAFSEENNKRLALAAARKASFRAKQTRQSLQMIR